MLAPLKQGHLAIPLAFSLLGCGGKTKEELPLEDISLALYSQPLIAGDDDHRFTMTFPAEETQYVEVALPPDRGIYILLVAGTMTLTLPDRVMAGSQLTMQELELEVTRDDFVPGGWMLGAKLWIGQSVAECTELADWGSHWKWRSVGDLQITTRDGRGREALPWRPNDNVGTMSESGGIPSFFPPVLDFRSPEAAP